MRLSVFFPFFLILAPFGITQAPLSGNERRDPIHLYAHASWKSWAGLPQDSVLALAQSPEGYIWVGTVAGLARFDGVRFVVFDRGNTPALVNHHIRALSFDAEGALWIATDGGGLVRYRSGRFRRFSEAEGLPHGRVISLAADPEGGVWAGTYGGGLARAYREEVRPFATPELTGLSIFALRRTADGALLIGTQSAGLYHLRDGEIVARYTTRDGLPDNFICALAQDRAGGVWIGTFRGLAKLENGAIRTYDTPHPTVAALLVDADNDLWIGTYGGLARRSGDRFEVFTAGDGLAGNAVWELFEDAHGQVWIGSDGGLDRLAAGPFVTYLHSAVTAYAEGRDQEHWVATLDGLYRLRGDGTAAAHWTVADGLVGEPIWHAAADREGALWIGSPQGAQRLAQAGWETYRQADGLPVDAVFYVLPTADGSVWLGTTGGVARLRDGEVDQVFSVDDGLIDNNIRSLLEDRKGGLWVGTTAGVSRIDPAGAISSYAVADGLSSNNIWALAESPAGDLWIATRGGGLNRIRDGAIASVTMRHGLPDDGLCNLYFDPRGNAWIGSTKGVFSVEADALDAVADARQERLYGELFDSSDGIRNTRCSSVGQVRSQSEDGRLWFPTYGGIAVLDPKRLRDRSARLRTLFEEIRIDGRPAPLPASADEPVVLAPQNRTLEIGYTALGSREPRQTRFRYRLSGYEKAWNVVGDRRNAYYTGLPPGRYRFELSARAAGGTWLAPLHLTLAVRPALHQTPIFAAAVVLGLVGLAWLLVRFFYLRRYLAELRHMQEKVTSKNLELERKNHELEEFAHSIAHDFRNPLLTIGGFAQMIGLEVRGVETDRLREYIRHITAAVQGLNQQLESLLEVARMGRVVRDPAEVDLEELVAEARARLAGTIQEEGIELVVAEDLPRVRGDRARLLAVVQNLLENAVKYCGETDAPRIEITARREGGEVVSTIRDNGIGIAPKHLDRIFSLFHQIDRDSEGSGIGLALVKRVVEAHGGRVEVASEGIGRGTAVSWTLPAGGR